MSDKTLPFTKTQIERITEKFPTPFHLYDEAAIRRNARRLVAAFAWAPEFKEYFAVKACPNPHLMSILREEGFGADCSSMAELVLAERVGLKGEEIILTSNDTPACEYQKARELGAVLNLDDIAQIPYVEANTGGLPNLISFRYNPGPLKGGNAIIGTPEEAKYGFTRDQILEGYRIALEKGVQRFSLHTMVASNELNPDYFIDTARMLFELAVEVLRETGVRVESINLGGGIGIPYRPEQNEVNLEYVSNGIRLAYEEIIRPAGLDPLKILMENGRMVTGPYGYLVSRVLHLKHTYRDYVGLDACMANLMRPALYGAYHHITVLGKENAPLERVYDVTGSLCENNDKFAIQRPMPEAAPGDLVAIHDAGAHGHAMGFNYNGKLRSAELLLKPDGQVVQIRRAETLDDYFATLDFTGI
ncbi:MAG TPA: diaminopimelate decarboxylase [Candidatus Sumerlaeota bacterium]|nr:diaminopimelate decarboxylase [Candidatus Sumerlaeota bacterium]